MNRVFIHVTGQGTHANQIDIVKAANLFALAQLDKNQSDFNDLFPVKQIFANSKLEQADSGTVFVLGGSSMEETCDTLIVMDIY